MRWPVLLLLGCGGAAVCPCRLFAQSPAPSLPDAPSTPGQQQAAPGAAKVPETEAERKAREHAQADKEVKEEEKQRLLAVVPNFNTVISGRAVPLSKGQKATLAVHATFDPFNFVSPFLLAGLNELSDSHRGYQWGPAGYFKRVGANFADIVDSTMLAGAVYPILLRQDPRYFRKATGPIRSRIAHALAAPYVCLGDDGGREFNYSNILGNFTSGAISNVYYPAKERGVSLTVVNASVVTLEGSLGNIGLEFAPDVAAYLRRRRHKPAAPPPAVAVPSAGAPTEVAPF